MPIHLGLPLAHLIVPHLAVAKALGNHLALAICVPTSAATTRNEPLLLVVAGAFAKMQMSSEELGAPQGLRVVVVRHSPHALGVEDESPWPAFCRETMHFTGHSVTKEVTTWQVVQANQF